jgi:hypothetical protein
LSSSIALECFSARFRMINQESMMPLKLGLDELRVGNKRVIFGKGMPAGGMKRYEEKQDDQDLLVRFYPHRLYGGVTSS